MDALSEALAAIRVTGAIYYSMECAAPWGFSVPQLSDDFAHVLAPEAERLVTYHLITEGEAMVQFGDDEPIAIRAGEILIIPHGDAHLVWNGAPATMVDTGPTLRDYLTGSLVESRVGEGGPVTRFICGYFGCERHADRMFLAGLPTMIKIDIRGDAGGGWIESSIRHLLSDAGANRPGQSVLLSKASETLFVEALRRYMEQLPPEQPGWLAAARDPIVGAALALIHRKPFLAWTLERLAAEAGTSRSVLSDRFARYLGEPPLSYLGRWRLQLAARQLRGSQKTIQRIACDVGYDSEAAFNRAFKREFGQPPARYRKQQALA
jgi:AraC-like DNA-binding protein